MLKNIYKLLAKLLAIFLIGLVCWMGFLGWQGYQLYRAIQKAQSLIEPARQGEIDLNAAANAVHDIQSPLEQIEAGLAPVLPLIENRAGPAGQVKPLLDYASELCSGADLLIQSISPAWDMVQHSETVEIRAVLLALQEQHSSLEEANLALARAADSRSRVDLSQLPPALKAKIEPYDRYFPLAQEAARLLAALPELAGSIQEMNYLIAAQNEDELRATGGFISAIGIARVAQGELVHFSLNDSYMLDNAEVDYPDPPAPLRAYMDAGAWLPRDANWSPDFPTAARQLEDLYELSVGAKVDGVIVFDQAAVERLLGVTGPVQVSGFDETVSGGSVRQWMREAWAPEMGEKVDLNWWAGRKDFMQSLGKAILERVLAMRDRQQLQQLLKTALDLLRQGHFLIYFHQPVAQDILANQDLDGGVRPGSGDFLMVVDSNIGFNKTDSLIQRQAAYRVDLSDPQFPTAQLELSYTHSLKKTVECIHSAYYGVSYADLTERCYWDFWRILAAPGSRLAAADPLPVASNLLLTGKGWDGAVTQVQSEGGCAQFSGLMVLPGASSQHWSVNWDLPLSVIQADGDSRVYTLKVQKQPGLGSYALSLQVAPPAGWRLADPPPGWQNKNPAGVWSWQGKIDRATVFRLVFQPLT